MRCLLRACDTAASHGNLMSMMVEHVCGVLQHRVNGIRMLVRWPLKVIITRAGMCLRFSHVASFRSFSWLWQIAVIWIIRGNKFFLSPVEDITDFSRCTTDVSTGNGMSVDQKEHCLYISHRVRLLECTECARMCTGWSWKTVVLVAWSIGLLWVLSSI